MKPLALAVLCALVARTRAEGFVRTDLIVGGGATHAGGSTTGRLTLGGEVAALFGRHSERSQRLPVHLGPFLSLEANFGKGSDAALTAGVNLVFAGEHADYDLSPSAFAAAGVVEDWAGAGPNRRGGAARLGLEVDRYRGAYHSAHLAVFLEYRYLRDAGQARHDVFLCLQLNPYALAALLDAWGAGIGH